LRILHVAEAFGGGLMEMVIALAEGSAEAGHDVLIAYGTRPETPATVRDRIDPGVELHALPWHRRTPDAQLRAGREVRRVVRDWNPDVVHLHSSFAGVVGAMVVDGGTPTVFSPNAFASVLPEAGWLRRRLYRKAERITCRRVTEVGAVSRSEAELARELGARRVTRVPNGIPELNSDRVRTRPADAPQADPPRVVATGRTVPQRRPEAAARILSQVRDVAEVEWLGGGGGRRGVAGHDALVAAGIPLSDWLPRAELLERIGLASAYLHWTAWDGLPLSILEAMALDVVVIASDIPPNREILGPDAVCAGEAEAAALLRRVVEDPAFAEELRASQRARRGEFSAENMVRGWHEVYDRLLALEPEAAGVAA
jgi:glycosyltransferase involved in cell wall biosynthesis